MFYVLIWEYSDSRRNRFVTDDIEKLFEECITPENLDMAGSPYYDLRVEVFEGHSITGRFIKIEDLVSLETFKEALK